jgi:uridylate kinase
VNKLKYKRVLLKLSGEAFLGEKQYGIEPEIVDKIAQEIAETKKSGAEIIIVIGGGNIFRGLAASRHGLDRTMADYIGMLATVMNSLALGSALTKIGLENRVQSAIEMPKICESYIRNRALSHLNKGRVVIVGAGSGNPYFSTDTAAAMRACELDCEAIFKATKVAGVFDKDPEFHPKAKLIPKLSYLDILNNGFRVMDNTAVTLSMDNKIPILVFELLKPGNIKKNVLGEVTGTIIN